MCDEELHPELANPKRYSRRKFGAMSAAAAAATLAAAKAYAQPAQPVVERDVSVPTPDGMADAALFYPNTRGRWPAVIFWPDIMTLRPAVRQMARRLAGEGYVVLAPNVYYRSRPASEMTLDFSNPESRASIGPMRALLTDENVVEDSRAFMAFLDAQPQTDTSAGAGVQGYCMSGPYTFRTAAALPNRIKAAASFHGGGLTTDGENSPHTLIPQIEAEYLVAIAQNDDANQPESKDILRRSFNQAGKPATVEVFLGDHGWTVPGSSVYDAAAAESAWAHLLSLYRRNLKA